VARYRGKVSLIYFRADAGFANPEVYFLDEAAGVPCCLPIVWRIFPQQHRAFDAGNKSGGTTITCVAG
jgi:hypothetical protein